MMNWLAHKLDGITHIPRWVNWLVIALEILLLPFALWLFLFTAGGRFHF